MEQLLLKIARQLDSLDEASLISLWEKYATLVANFEPTKRWEEAALVFSLIQAKQWKNQLFNHHWANQVRPDRVDAPPLPSAFVLEREQEAEPQKKAAILSFRPKAAEAPQVASPETDPSTT